MLLTPKKTFEAIRSEMGGTFKASCKGAFNKIKQTDGLDLRYSQIALCCIRDI